MIRLALAIIALLISTGCSTQYTTNISYSSNFNLEVGPELLSDSIVFMSDNIAIKTSRGQVIAPLVITSELEGLPDNFNLHMYPKFILGLVPIADLPDLEMDKFKNSKLALSKSYNTDNVHIRSSGVFEIYTACKELDCYSLATKLNVKNQILALYSKGFTPTELAVILKGLE